MAKKILLLCLVALDAHGMELAEIHFDESTNSDQEALSEGEDDEILLEVARDELFLNELPKKAQTLFKKELHHVCRHDQEKKALFEKAARIKRCPHTFGFQDNDREVADAVDSLKKMLSNKLVESSKQTEQLLELTRLRLENEQAQTSTFKALYENQLAQNNKDKNRALIIEIVIAVLGALGIGSAFGMSAME